MNAHRRTLLSRLLVASGIGVAVGCVSNTSLGGAETSDASADGGTADASADGPPASCALVEAGALPAPGFCHTVCYIPGAAEMSAHDHKCCDGGVLPSAPCLVGDAAVPAIEAANDAMGGCCGWWVEALIDGPDPATMDKCCYTVVSINTGRPLVVACVARVARATKRSDWRA